jgi:hypothetical protein
LNTAKNFQMTGNVREVLVLLDWDWDWDWD